MGNKFKGGNKKSKKKKGSRGAKNKGLNSWGEYEAKSVFEQPQEEPKDRKGARNQYEQDRTNSRKRKRENRDKWALRRQVMEDNKEEKASEKAHKRVRGEAQTSPTKRKGNQQVSESESDSDVEDDGTGRRKSAYETLLESLNVGEYQDLVSQRKREQEGEDEAEEGENEEVEEGQEVLMTEAEFKEFQKRNPGMIAVAKDGSEDENGDEDMDETEEVEEVGEEEEEEEEVSVDEDSDEEDNEMDECKKHFFSRVLSAQEILAWSQHKAKYSSLANKLASAIGLDFSIDGEPLRDAKATLRQNKVKKSLCSKWQQEAADAQTEPATGAGAVASLSSLQSLLFPALNDYHDLMFTGQSLSNIEETQQICALHILNHVLKERGWIAKHNTKLRAQQLAAEGSGGNDKDAEGEEDATEYKDQGFTRPTVLVLVPYRAQAYEMISSLVSLLPDGMKVLNRERLDAEYGPGEEEEDEDEDEDEEEEGGGGEEEQEQEQTGKRKKSDPIAAGKKKAKKSSKTSKKQEKPADFEELFGGNVDDCFQIGLAFARKGFKLYSEFYDSDIIIASPLGLKRTIGVASVDSLSGGSTKDKDLDGDDVETGVGDAAAAASAALVSQSEESDFLSSIEVVVVGRADVLHMQNWDHVVDVFQALNLIPKRPDRTDFARVREWNLAGHARSYRQTVLLSAHTDVVTTALFHRLCANTRGRVRMQPQTHEGAIATEVIVSTRQIFSRIPERGLAADADERFNYFRDHIFKQLQEQKQGHTLIYIPSYFDYVRVRNLFRVSEDDPTFCCVCEYSRTPEVSRGRSNFFNDRVQVMIYTGRFHFFHRYKIRGIRNLIFYALPTFPNFYAEMVNVIEEAQSSSEPTSAIALYSKYEKFQLERIVGTQRAKRMLKSNKSTHLFC